MKKIIIIAGVATMLSSTLWAQDTMKRNNQHKDHNKTEMQNGDSKKSKRDSTRKMNKNRKSNDSNRNMNNNNSNNNNNQNEQKHMDSTINNHR
jgi:hypothetical protein